MLYSINLVFLKEIKTVCKYFQMSTPTTTATITTKKDKNEEQFELEQQFILRMPAVIISIDFSFELIDFVSGRICNTFT